MEEEKTQIKRGDELIDFAKNVSKQVSRLRIGHDVDYMGCSRGYIYEKVHTAIQDLEWIIDRIAELHNEQVRCDECRDFNDQFDSEGLCVRCSDDEDWKENY